MNLREILVKHKVIEDVFSYEDLDEEIKDKYSIFDKKFDALYKSYSVAYELKDCLFYIKSNFFCNAFACKIKGYNIIGVTNSYAIVMQDLFDEKYFELILLVALMNNKQTSDAYCDLSLIPNFKFNEFMLDCSIHYTFSHEFRHILQFNSTKKDSTFRFNENVDSNKFSMKRHAWEFDADRFAAFEVLKHIFQVKRDLNVKDDEIFKCMLYLGLSSVILTKLLFYYRIVPSIKSPIERVKFYTGEKSHPHPLVRIFNILEYFFENVKTDFPKMNYPGASPEVSLPAKPD